MNASLTTITLRQNEWTPLAHNHFYYATDGQEAPQPTMVRLKYDEQFLYIEFECLQNPFVHQNTYRQHNTDMWNQEVFEVFIAAGQETPTRYLEIELNPNNALFVGWIENPTLEAPENLSFVPYNMAQIEHSATMTTDSWQGSLKLPWMLVGGKQKNFRLNFYRIVSLQPHTNPDWKGSPDDCAYLCWSPTMSGDTPRFHRPAAFGVLKLKD
ncbi:MAG: carbohydrate-binding family 9-like protein [Runella sp.]